MVEGGGLMVSIAGVRLGCVVDRRRRGPLTLALSPEDGGEGSSRRPLSLALFP